MKKKRSARFLAIFSFLFLILLALWFGFAQDRVATHSKIHTHDKSLEISQGPVLKQQTRTPVEAKPQVQQSPDHRCGKGCLHESTAHAQEEPWQPVSLRRRDSGGIHLRSAETFLDLSGTQIFISEHGGHPQKAYRLEDGSTLYLAFNDEAWEGNIFHRSRSQAYLLRGEGDFGEIRKSTVDQILCARVDKGKTLAGLLPNPVKPAETLTNETFEVAAIQPIFNSLPNANGCIYLDFDGELVSGTNWNAAFTGGAAIDAASPGYTTSQIETIWQRVAEDFLPFNVTVTTDRSVYDSYPSFRRTMVIFTTNYQWYGEAGGVAYVNIFGSTNDSPAWVFTPWTGGHTGAHEAASHEAGHTLGLSHDGTLSQEYYGGNGTWGPIMGGSYSPSIVQWSKGEYADANNQEDDLAIIASTRNGLGYRLDDHGNTPTSASPLNNLSGNNFSANGIIERNTDIDVFSLTCGSGTLDLSAANFFDDPNLDIKLTLLSAGGSAIASYDSTASTDATLSLAVSAGTYFVAIEGTGTVDPLTGYSDYGSLGSYTLSITAPPIETVSASILSPASPLISLPEGTGLVLQGEALGGAAAWTLVNAPSGSAVNFTDPNSDSTRVTFSQAGNYQLRLSASDGEQTATADLFVSVEIPGETQEFPNRGPAIDLGPDRDVFNFELQIDPQVSDDGSSQALGFEWSVLAGDVTLSSSNVLNPIVTFNQAGSSTLRLVVTDGDIRSFQEVEFNARFVSQSLINTSNIGRVFVPTDDRFGDTWKDPTFNDATWKSGVLGTGYDATPGNESRKLFAPFISSGLSIPEMEGNASSCYLRVPFTLESSEAVLKLNLGMQYDDGFVAYINGTEVARSNVPTGSPRWDTLAASDRDEEAATSAVLFALDLSGVSFVDGINVLAIHGLNSAIAGRGVKEPNFLLLPTLEAILAEGLPTTTSSPYETTIGIIEEPNQQGHNDDPDGDGLDNLTEHALGLNPTSPSYLTVLRPFDANSIELLFPLNPPSDVEYLFECNSTLASDGWVTLSSRIGETTWNGIQPSVTANGDPQFQSLRFPHDNPQGCYYRIRFRLQTP